MTDFTKYTVVKLKEELKHRGLPQTGLKAALIARLSEAISLADAETVLDVVELPETIPEDDSKLELSKDTLPELKEPPISEAEVPAILVPDQTEADTGPQPPLQNLQDNPSILNGETTESISEKARNELQTAEPAQRPLAEPVTEPNITLPEVTAVLDSPQNGSITQKVEVPTSNEKETMASLESRQTSVNKDEILEDSRKRKRRSQSPPPSAHEAALKKSKALDGSPRVKLPVQTDVKEDSEDHPVAEVGVIEVTDTNGNTYTDIAMRSPGEEASSTLGKEVAEPLPSEESKVEITPPVESGRKLSSGHADILQSPVKPSPSDTRFKSLFNVPAKPEETTAKHDLYVDLEDREISPAIHPATSALYIRNFMRPLQPASLRAHLEALARPPTGSPFPDIISDFFLDSIKTHCLVRFANVSAASRVRIALHDRVWPDERTRKPLWADFVPEEKLQKWIEVEMGGSGVRQQGSKRWEVVYEQEEDSITAYLQEADGTAPARPPVPASSAVQKIPTGPRPVDAKPQAVAMPKADTGKGFKALDDLFQSTVAKPKLYYQPVPESVASKRLEKLAQGRGGGRSDEMRRFSFEEDMIVDKGPEFGLGWRGGARGRGGYSGGYGARGGGGGYRGGRGDSWR
ncbi:hypothetical protein MMC19_003973 [Ptychographa xylographoides]|nr:hypothetical protein [Ptychographa xylographoides]